MSNEVIATFLELENLSYWAWVVGVNRGPKIQRLGSGDEGWALWQGFGFSVGIEVSMSITDAVNLASHVIGPPDDRQNGIDHMATCQS